VNWRATATFGTVLSVINISGNGIFNVESGQIGNTGSPIPGIFNPFLYVTINNTSGTLNILGGTVESAGGIAINNANSGTVNISGGRVSTISGQAIVNNGKINVSGTGLVSAEHTTIGNVRSGVAIRARNTANVSISGGKVSSTNGNAIDNDGTVKITGGTVENTVSGDAINNSGALNIFGGTITSPKSAINISSGTTTLSNSPTINGTIYSFSLASLIPNLSTNGKLRVLEFTPGEKKYTLEFSGYVEGDVAVENGANYIDNFVFSSAYDLATGTMKDWSGIKSGNDIVMQSR
jgi:hypothetical protein